MKVKWNKRLIMLVGMCMLFGFQQVELIREPILVYAHSGRTDSSGGHKDNKNKSGLGSYHYHCDGNPAHLHDGGVCPYATQVEPKIEEAPVKPKENIVIQNAPKELNMGDTFKVEYNVENAVDSNSSIVSSDSNIVKVNENKTLTAVGEGSAEITVSSTEATSTFTIAVKSVPVTKVTINSEISQMEVQEEQSLDIVIEPENASNQSVTWSSSDENVVTVTEKGKITAVKKGKADVIVTTSNGIQQTKSIEVLPISPKEIKTENKEIKVLINKTEKLKVEIIPESAEDKTYTVESKDENICTISEDGTIVPVSEGKGSLTVLTWNGVKQEIPVEVYHIEVEKIEIDDSKLNYMEEGKIDFEDTIDLTATISPQNATYQDIVWESNDPSIVEVTENGFEIKGKGKVVLTASVQDGKSAKIEFEVVEKSSAEIIVGIAVIAALAGSGVVFYKKKKVKK